MSLRSTSGWERLYNPPMSSTDPFVAGGSILSFRLLERVLSRRVAWTATAFLVIGPPSLVLWTLSGSAEIVMTLLAGSVLLLAVESATSSRSRSAPATLKGSLYFFTCCE